MYRVYKVVSVCADEKTEDEQEQNLFMVKFEHHLLDNVSLQGIRNVRKVFMRQEETTVVKENVLDGYERKKEWLLDSEGINLAEVLQADNVDAQRTISNHVVEMFEVLGIEAARLSVLKELRAVLEFDGSKVNYRCGILSLCAALFSEYLSPDSLSSSMHTVCTTA